MFPSIYSVANNIVLITINGNKYTTLLTNYIDTTVKNKIKLTSPMKKMYMEKIHATNHLKEENSLIFTLKQNKFNIYY